MTEATERNEINADPSRKFGLLMTSGGNFGSDAEGASTTTIIAGSDIYAGSSGGYRTADVQTTDAEAIPKLDFYLTYNPQFATTTFGEVTFTLTEHDALGNVVGNIDVNVTLSTIIDEFRSQKYDLVAMHNDFGLNEYTRKLVLPASMQRRNLYLTSVQWQPCIGSEQVSVGGNLFNRTGLSTNCDTVKFYLTDSTGQKDNFHFGLKLVPTEHISQSMTTTLGWYSIDDPTIDVFRDATRSTGTNSSYSGTNTDTPIPLNGAILDDLANLDIEGGTPSPNYTGSRGDLVGVLDGRSSAAIDLTLLFDGSTTYTKPDGCRGEVILHFDYWNGNKRQGSFDVTVYIRTRSSGDTIYLASANTLSRTVTTTVNGVTTTQPYTLTASTNTQTMNRGKKPSTYIQSLSVAFLSGIYQAGDVLCILDELDITDNQSLRGLNYNYIPVVRYEGHHHEYPGRECAYRGSMIKISDGGKLTADNMIFDGSMVSRYQTEPYHYAVDTLKADGPIFEVAQGGTLILGNNTVVQNNYNQCTETSSGKWGGAASVTGSNSILKLENDVTFKNNLVPDSTGFNSGAVHVDGGTVLLSTSKSGTAVMIEDNYKINSRYVFKDSENNVTLPDNPRLANVYLTRKPLANHTDNLLADGQSDLILFENIAPKTRIGITKEFPGPADRDTIRIAQVRGSQQLYAQHAFDSLNFFNDGNDGKIFYNSTISPLTIYFQRCATFRKQLYNDPDFAAGSNPLKYIVLQDNIPTAIPSGINQQPVLAYKWNQYAACPDETDSLIYHIHGGFYPYTYTWSWGTDANNLTTYREVKTPYTNDAISSDMADATSATRFDKANASNRDAAELEGMLFSDGQGGSTFYYSVTASDLAGCKLTEKVQVTLSREISNPVGVTLTNPAPINSEHETLRYAWNDTAATIEHTATRNFHGIHLIAEVQPVSSWGTVTGTLNNTNNSVGLTANGTLLCPGDAVRLNATANNETTHRFLQWDFDPYDESSTVFVMPHSTSNVTINAYFGPNSYWKDVVDEMPSSGVTYEYDGDVHISTAEGLAWLISLANGLHGQQIRDFYFDTVHIAAGTYDMSEHLWTPLGNAQHPFMGVLNVADGATISGIIVDEPRMDHVGFFAYLDKATINGLKLTKSLFHGSQYVGGIAAEATNTTIQQSLITDSDGDGVDGNNITIITANYASGGLVGKATNSTMIDGCSAKAKFMGATIYNGGILGYGEDVSVTNTYSWFGPRMSTLYSGGSIGYSTSTNNGSKSHSGNYIANNYVRFIGPYNALNRVGGLVGYARTITMENNYVYGSTQNGTLTGALAAMLDRGVEVNNCYYEQGSNADAFGYNTSGNHTAGITTFNGTGNQVLMADRVDGSANLTLALNRWVRDHAGEGFATWRSDLEGTNHGYPRFGTPDIVPVYEHLSYETCDSFIVAGETLTESGEYEFHLVDSADFVDSVISLTLMLNYSSLTQFEDTVLQGEDYDANGFHLTATEIDLLRQTVSQGETVTIVVSDTMQSVHGCDSIVTLYLTVGKHNDGPSLIPDIKVYPNPTIGQVTVESDAMQTIELYDGVSRLLNRRTVEGSSCSLDLSALPSGMYYLRVKTDNGTIIKKIVKQ